MRYSILILIAVLVFSIGCSGGGSSPDPVQPIENREVKANNSHECWGLWQFTADLENQTLDCVQLRQGMMHLNALPFLEPPALVNLSLDSLEINGNIIEADIGLRHPFLGLDEFTGFDVCGILITKGSVSGFDDSDIVMVGDGDTRLLNADGYSRWWNPSEFTVNDGSIFAYNDGLLGTPDSFANYDSTINGYKYYCEQLEADDLLGEVDPLSRGVFSAGQKNIRHYTIEMGDGLVFNYAIDACWQFPQGDAPWTIPDDFAPEANRAEAWQISVTELSNTLYNDGATSGGELHLNVDVYDCLMPISTRSKLSHHRTSAQ